MSAALTLYVVHSTRSPEILADSIAAARWASTYTAKVVAVVDQARQTEYTNCGADLLVGSAIKGDFRFFDGIREALHIGLDFEQSICFKDDALFLHPGLDQYAAKYFYRDKVCLLGSADRQYYGDGFLQVSSLFSKWRVPHEHNERAPAGFTISPAVFCLAADLAKELYYRRLLVPPEYEAWPLPFSVYVSWLCQLMLMPSGLVGSMDRPAAPLYVNDGWRGMYNPPPHILHPQFLAYWSARQVAGYSEADLREWNKKRRTTS